MKTLLFFALLIACGHIKNEPDILLFASNLPYMMIIFYFYKYFRNKKLINGEISDFWLNEKEKETYYALQTEYNNLEKEIQEAYKKENQHAERELSKYTRLYNDAKYKLESLHNEGIKSNISRNKDGQFSSRSNAGKELNRAIAETRDKITLYSNEVFQAQKLFPPEPSIKYSKINDLNSLKEKPLKKWNKVKSVYCGYKASRAALVVFCICLVSITFPAVFLADSSVGQTAYKNFFAQIPGLNDLLLSSPNYFEVLQRYAHFLRVGAQYFTEINFPTGESMSLAYLTPIWISLTTLIAFRVSKSFHNTYAEEEMTPKPPQVDLNNYNLY